MANVSYQKLLVEPNRSNLKFQRAQNGTVVSELITLKFRIKLHPLAQKPIAAIALRFDMLYPGIYQFEDYGDTREILYRNISSDFSTDEIKLQVQIVDPDIMLDRKVVFVVTVMDVDEGLSYPSSGDEGFYQWHPTVSLINSTPSNLL